MMAPSHSSLGLQSETQSQKTKQNKTPLQVPVILNVLFFLSFLKQSPDWSATAQSQLTTTSSSQLQAILLPQLPKQLGLQVRYHAWLIFVFLV